MVGGTLPILATHFIYREISPGKPLHGHNMANLTAKEVKGFASLRLIASKDATKSNRRIVIALFLYFIFGAFNSTVPSVLEKIGTRANNGEPEGSLSWQRERGPLFACCPSSELILRSQRLVVNSTDEKSMNGSVSYLLLSAEMTMHHWGWLPKERSNDWSDSLVANAIHDKKRVLHTSRKPHSCTHKSVVRCSTLY